MRTLITAILSLALASCLISAEETFPKTRHLGDDAATGGDATAGDPLAGDPGIAPPDPVTGFTATAGERAVELTWDSVIDGVMVRGAIGDYPSGPTAGGEVFNGLGTQVTHSDQPGGVEIYYAAWTYVGSPRVYSTTAAQATATPTDTTAPDAPTDIVLTPHPVTVDLTWTNPGNADFSHVVVVRSDGAMTVPADGISIYNGNAEAVTDTSLTPDTLYYYGIWAYDDATPANVSIQLPGTTTTTIVANEFEECDPSGGGMDYCDPRVTSLTCTPRSDGIEMCVVACPGGTCPSDRYCDRDSDFFGVGFDFCWPTADKNTPCLPDASTGACVDSECVAGTSTSGAPVCRDTCDITAATCTDGETCLVGANLEHDNLCTLGGGECNGTSGWACHELEPNTCARPAGRCGIESDVLTAFDPTAIIDHVSVDTNQCDMVGAGNFCPQPTEGTAWSACLQVGGFVKPFQAPCSNDTDCLRYGADCLDVSGTGSECALPIHSCVLVCETELGGETLTCPSGMTCGEARTPVNPQDLILLVAQMNGTVPMTCTIPSNCDTGFSCIDYGTGTSYCVRNRKVCQN